ncbi:hypothetical protein D3C80_1867790 [compost metagenome]
MPCINTEIITIFIFTGKMNWKSKTQLTTYRVIIIDKYPSFCVCNAIRIHPLQIGVQ